MPMCRREAVHRASPRPQVLAEDLDRAAVGRRMPRAGAIRRLAGARAPIRRDLLAVATSSALTSHAVTALHPAGSLDDVAQPDHRRQHTEARRCGQDASSFAAKSSSRAQRGSASVPSRDLHLAGVGGLRGAEALPALLRRELDSRQNCSRPDRTGALPYVAADDRLRDVVKTYRQGEAAVTACEVSALDSRRRSRSR